jgi:hypothetical protein
VTSADINKIVKHNSTGKYYIIAEILKTKEIRCIEVFPRIMFEDMHTQAIFDSIELTHINTLMFDDKRNSVSVDPGGMQNKE